MHSPAAAGPQFAPSHHDAVHGGDFPCGPQSTSEAVGLALSGGGYRAMLFHLGALHRLNELGWLPRLDRISTVSGGSIFAGVLARAWERLTWDAHGRATNFDGLITRPTLDLTSRRLDLYLALVGPVPIVNPASLLARWLDSVLTHGMRLDQLPERPRFVINAANLGTGVSWRFSKPYMHDVRLGVICRPRVPLADAIAASAAFPPFFSPFVLDLRGMEVRRSRGADLFDDPRYASMKERVQLLDGGAYDHLGIESVEGHCRTVLASDAGGSLRVSPRGWRYGFWLRQLRRTLDMSLEVGRTQRRRALIDRAGMAYRIRDLAGVSHAEGITEHVALWRTTLDVGDHPLHTPAVPVAAGWREYLATRATRFWPMPEADRLRLVNWGYLTSDLVLRSYVPELRDAAPAEALPYPELGFSRPPG